MNMGNFHHHYDKPYDFSLISSAEQMVRKISRVEYDTHYDYEKKIEQVMDSFIKKFQKPFFDSVNLIKTHVLDNLDVKTERQIKINDEKFSKIKTSYEDTKSNNYKYEYKYFSCALGIVRCEIYSDDQYTYIQKIDTDFLKYSNVLDIEHKLEAKCNDFHYVVTIRDGLSCVSVSIDGEFYTNDRTKTLNDGSFIDCINDQLLLHIQPNLNIYNEYQLSIAAEKLAITEWSHSWTKIVNDVYYLVKKTLDIF